MSLQLNEPIWLLGLPILIWLFWWGHRLRWRFTYVPVQPNTPGLWQSYLTLWSAGWIGLSLLLALAEPVWIYPATRPKLPPLWVLWDVSHSMRNADLPPDRRRYALALWEKALDTLRAHEAQTKMGLIVFARGAYGLLPLTSDIESFRWALRQAIILDLGEGTDLAEALEMALSNSEPGMHLVIVSDGAHNNPLSADLREITSLAEARAIPIHALWVGQDSATTFPQALQYLSERTGGRFWVNAFTLRLLYRYETLPTLYPLQKTMIISALAGIFVMGIALSVGWFNLLSA